MTSPLSTGPWSPPTLAGQAPGPGCPLRVPLAFHSLRRSPGSPPHLGQGLQSQVLRDWSAQGREGSWWDYGGATGLGKPLTWTGIAVTEKVGNNSDFGKSLCSLRESRPVAAAGRRPGLIADSSASAAPRWAGVVSPFFLLPLPLPLARGNRWPLLPPLLSLPLPLPEEAPAASPASLSGILLPPGRELSFTLTSTGGLVAKPPPQSPSDWGGGGATGAGQKHVSGTLGAPRRATKNSLAPLASPGGRVQGPLTPVLTGVTKATPTGAL